MKEKVCLVYCRCGAGIFSGVESDNLADALRETDAEVYEMHDLCALSLHEKEKLSLLGKQYSRKIVIACYPRSVEYLFRQNGIDFGTYEVINFRGIEARQVVDLLRDRFGVKEGNATWQSVVSQLKVPAWYPVIDTSRCTHCGLCARFCLFGVYRFGKKDLSVVNPLACKNNCPACGRICPESALIFPRLPESSVLSGAEPSADNVAADRVINGQLLEKLKERNKLRAGIFKTEVLRKAEAERDEALKNITENNP